MGFTCTCKPLVHIDTFFCWHSVVMLYTHACSALLCIADLLRLASDGDKATQKLKKEGRQLFKQVQGQLGRAHSWCLSYIFIQIHK